MFGNEDPLFYELGIDDDEHIFPFDVGRALSEEKNQREREAELHADASRGGGADYWERNDKFRLLRERLWFIPVSLPGQVGRLRIHGSSPLPERLESNMRHDAGDDSRRKLCFRNHLLRLISLPMDTCPVSRVDTRILVLVVSRFERPCRR